MNRGPVFEVLLAVSLGYFHECGAVSPAQSPAGRADSTALDTTGPAIRLELAPGTGSETAGPADSARRAPVVAEPEHPVDGHAPGEVIVVDYHEAVREHDVLFQAIPELLTYVQKSTRISAPLAWHVRPLFSPEVQRALLLYMTGQDARFHLRPVEKQALGEYLNHGGLLFGEDVVSGGTQSLPPRGGGVEGTPFDRQFKALIADPLVLGPAGRRWQSVPLDHPLYHIYFDFPDGPPLGAAYTGTASTLEMVEYRGRVAVVFSDLNLSWYWANPDAIARERPLQLGVNVIVLALARHYAGPSAPVRR